MTKASQWWDNRVAVWDDEGSLLAAAKEGELDTPSLAVGGERGLAIVTDGGRLVAYRLPTPG